MADKTVNTACLLLSFCISFAFANELARGWGDHFEWKTLEDGLNAAKREKKPLILVIHKSWCGACKAFKPRFAESYELRKFKDDFIFVNTQDDEEPKENEYHPDGGYIPRILFLDHNGNVRPEFYNLKGNEKYKHYFYDPLHVVESMKKVMNEMTYTAPSDEL